MFILIGWTPLLSAAEKGYLGIAEVLVTHGADVNVNGSRFGKFLNTQSYWVDLFFTFNKKILSRENICFP